MTYMKLVRFKDVTGNRHSYMATYIDGVISSSDWQNIQAIKHGSAKTNK